MAKALTAKSVEQVKPGESRREIPDGLLTGLYLVVQPSGAKSWAVRYRFGGKPRKLTLGTFPALPLEKAREAAQGALRSVQLGTDDPAAAKKARRAERTAEENKFGSVIVEFIERYAKRENRSWQETARTLGLRVGKTRP